MNQNPIMFGIPVNIIHLAEDLRKKIIEFDPTLKIEIDH